MYQKLITKKIISPFFSKKFKKVREKGTPKYNNSLPKRTYIVNFMFTSRPISYKKRNKKTHLRFKSNAFTF